MNSRTKHIDIKYHFLREHVLNGDFVFKYVATNGQLVDIFTKPLSKDVFEILQQQLGVSFIMDWFPGDFLLFVS